MWKTELSKVFSPVNLSEPDDNIKYLEKLLQPIDYISSEPESDVSDLSDIFEEFHKSSFLRAYADPNKKYLTKNEADWKTAESFTNEFRKIMKVTRDELGIDDSMLDEEKAVQEILDSKLPFKKMEANTDKDSITIRKQNSRRSSNLSEDSTTWQRLLANSDSNFEVTHPILNLFGGEAHWLVRPDITWQKVDESRTKCESWFEHQ